MPASLLTTSPLQAAVAGGGEKDVMNPFLEICFGYL